SVLHQVVRDNLRTLYAAIEQGFAAPLPRFVREELEVTSIAACFREASQCWRAQNAPCASSSGSLARVWGSVRRVWVDEWPKPPRISWSTCCPSEHRRQITTT